MREIVIDTETTGLDFKSGDRVIEVGCVELINHVATEKSLQFYCSTRKTISKSATGIHGLTNEFLDNQPTFEDQAKSLLEFIANDTLIIHNAEFDLGFINNELKIIGLEPLSNKVIDTVSLARKKLNTRIANLDYLCRRFSIDLSERKLHGALLDSRLLAEVYLELIGGKQIALNLDSDTKKTNIKKIDNNTKKHDISRVHASKIEINQHKEMIKTIKNSIWEKFDY